MKETFLTIDKLRKKNKKLIVKNRELKEEIKTLTGSIAAITKIQAPAFSNFSEYEVLDMSPTQLINHVNDLLRPYGMNKS